MTQQDYKIVSAIFSGVVGVVCILAIVGLISIIQRCTNRPPVEENRNSVNVDSIVKINDSIKIKVEYLDSIKNAKVIEVVNLSNDSTVKLFFELVSE